MGAAQTKLCNSVLRPARDFNLLLAAPAAQVAPAIKKICTHGAANAPGVGLCGADPLLPNADLSGGPKPHGASDLDDSNTPCSS